MKTLSKRLTLEQGKVTKELYDPKEAISLLKSTSSAKFDESMEAHISLAIDPKYSEILILMGSSVLDPLSEAIPFLASLSDYIFQRG